jgi:Sensors of blue-light using FAD
MLQLVYVSAAAVPFNDASLRTLLARARSKNAAVDVSGMLLHQAGTFMQVLEGEARVVETVFERISRDPRHKRVVLLMRRETERNFADWSMGFVDVQGTAERLPGFRAIGNLNGLAGDTVAIQSVIAAFRDGRWRQEQAP